MSNLWLTFHNARDTNQSPSALIGLLEGSYEAYCFNQAVWYAGSLISNEIDKVGQKKAKSQASQEAARDRKLKQLLGQKDAKSQYADPAALFESTK